MGRLKPSHLQLNFQKLSQPFYECLKNISTKEEGELLGREKYL